MREPVTKLIRVALLDEPGVIARIHIDDDSIRSLAQSIRDTGLINPICVFAKKGRFEIAAGHRRYLAVKSLGWDEVRCDDYTNTGIPPEQVKVMENLERSQMSDAEWIELLRHYRDDMKYDLEQLMKVTGRSEAWIADRLNILRGDDDIKQALLRKELKLSQAIRLNRFPDAYRKAYVLQAIQSGAPARVIDKWLQDFKLMNLPATLPEGSQPIVQPTDMPGIAGPNPCVLCQERHSTWTMEMVTVHKGCIDSILKQMHG